MEKNRLEQQIEFCKEIDKEKFIQRQTIISNGERRETDAEHSWHIAIMAYLLSEYANEKIDVCKTIVMLLVHDLVEIDAGDTPAYDEEGKKTQKARELAAADRIFSILPDDQGEKLRSLWDEFEACDTPESKFAHTMDNIQPAMLNALCGGKSWEERKVRISQILERNKSTGEGSKELWEYAYQNFIQPNLEAGKIINDKGE